MRIKTVSVYVHWSVLLIGGVMLLAAIQRPLLTVAGVAAYLGVLLLHEVGHMIMAERRGCEVLAIELYPIHGVCRFEVPWSRYDHAVIAWGGVLAQAMVGVPIVVWVSVFGYTRWEPLNAVLALFGFFGLGIALLNLIPVSPLDGAIAWSLIPELPRRERNRRSGRPRGWRT